jgi:3-oxoacyl-[acyl-carrier-protein] synthase II
MTGDVMTINDDQGRPVVAVTGIGVITSLGIGKAENWVKLSKGESGIRQIARFETAGLRTTIAGTVDVVTEEPFSCTGLSERLAEMAALEAVGDAGFGRNCDFPGPLFVGIAPVEMEWPHREALADACNGGDHLSYDDLLTAAATGRFRAIYERSRAGSIAD